METAGTFRTARVRSEQDWAMQSILQFKLSPGFDKLEEELRTFEGLVNTYHAIFGEAISDSITQAVIKSLMPAEIRTHLELQTFARTTDLVNLMSSLSKMRTATTSASSAGYAFPRARVRARARARRKGKGKSKSKGKGKEKPRARSSRDGVTTAEIGSQSCKLLAWKRETGAPSARYSWFGQLEQLTVYTVGQRDWVIQSACENAEVSWIFMVADAVAINQLSMDGAHNLVVDSGAYVHVCPKSYATHVTLQALPTCWRGLDLRSASGKMLKVWGMREVVYNAMDLHGKEITVKIAFVVREVRRPLLSMAMLEDKGFHLTVKDGCQKLGGRGREINLRRRGNS